MEHKKSTQTFNLGPPGQTRDHDYKRFFIAVLFAVAVGAVGVWSYKQGYTAIMLVKMGAGFSIFFVLLLGCAVVVSLYEAWIASREINDIKRIGDNVEALKAKFQLTTINAVTYTHACRAVDRHVAKSMGGLMYIYSISFNVGFFGTLVGILIGLAPLDLLSTWTQETLGPRMPVFTQGMNFAIWTAVAGLIVSMVAQCMLYILWRSALTLQDRVERAFHNAIVDR